MAPTGTTYQPLPKSSMDVPDEKAIDSFRLQADDCACSRQSQCAHGQQVNSHCTRHQHRSCHNERRKRALRIASACLAGMMLTALALVSMSDGSCLGDFGFGLGGSVNGTSGESLWKRQGAPDGTGTGNGQQGVFVRNRLYLIVVFVGLFLCLVLAIMLAFWCCRSSFENPLCCPCYLCACCGGLMCLQCISCGLCAEGVDQIGYA